MTTTLTRGMTCRIVRAVLDRAGRAPVIAITAISSLFPMPGTVPLEVVAVRDIGVVAAELLVDPTVIQGNAIGIAGDVLTGDQIAYR